MKIVLFKINKIQYQQKAYLFIKKLKKTDCGLPNIFGLILKNAPKLPWWRQRKIPFLGNSIKGPDAHLIVQKTLMKCPIYCSTVNMQYAINNSLL